MSPRTYEALFGLTERPFSLTPDPKYVYRSRAHGRAIDVLTFGLRRRERFLLLSGDLGVGKTLLCRALADTLQRRGVVSVVGDPLLSPERLLQALADDFGASGLDAPAHDGAPRPHQLVQHIAEVLAQTPPPRQTAVVIIDEAHTLPPALIDPLLDLTRIERDGERLVQVLLAGQSSPEEPDTLDSGVLDDQISTRARLQALGRDECAEYVAHRLVVAGGAPDMFTARAVDVIYALSGGVPRLINLVCERALQEAATAEATHVEATAVEAAASALQLLRLRPRRFRWFSRRVS